MPHTRSKTSPEKKKKKKNNNKKTKMKKKTDVEEEKLPPKTFDAKTKTIKETHDETKTKIQKKKNVFAKLEGFRWWPALLLSKKDLKRMEIENERMIRMLKLPRKKTREECECVRFHGTGDVSLLARDKIVELNEESFKAHVGESLEAFGRRSGGENASSSTGGGGKKPSAAFLKAVEEAVRWEREHENDAASSSSSSSEGEEDDEEEEVKKEEKKARNGDSNDATSGGKKTPTTPTKNNNKKKKDEAVAKGVVALKTAAEAAVGVVSAAATEKKQKKVDSTPAVETVVNDDSSRKKTIGGAAAAASKERRESGKTASTAAPATTANKKKTTTTTTTNKVEKESPDKAEEKMVDVKREEEQAPVKPSSVQEEKKEEEAPAPIAPSSPPPPPPPPPLPLEPTKTWLEFSPIEASSFDASMMSDQENPTTNKASAVVSIAPNEDIEQSSIIVQNEQMQLEEAHLNGARLTRNQRNNNNNMNENNKKKAREQQQQFPSNANDRNTLEEAKKKSVSFAKQEKMSANDNNNDDDDDGGGEAQQRGVIPKTTQYGTSTLNNAKVPSAGASRGASQHLPRGGAGAVSAAGGKALDSRFYKSCHQCQQQHVASPCEFGGANGSNNSNNNNNNADNDVGKNDTGNQQQTSAASKCCGVSFCDQCMEKFYSHLTRSQCRKKCPKCRGLCNCRLCLRKEDVVGKTSSLYSSGKSSNAANNIATLFEDSENLALASLEATLGILERKKRASYCLVAMEKAFAKSAEFDAWEIEREEKKKKEEEKQSGRNSKLTSPSDDNDDDDNDEDAGDEDRKNNKKRKKSNVSANVPSAFCDACANDIVAVCLSCDECDVRVCAYCISTLRKGTEAPYVERVCCLSLDDIARAKIKAELSRRILSEKPPAAEMKNTTSIAAAQKGSSGSPHVNNDASPSARKQRESTNNDENDSALLPMKKRLKMAFKTLNSSFTDGSDDDLEKKSPEKPSDAAVAQQQQQQQLQRKQREEKALAAAAALEVAKKSKLEDDIICVACDEAMKIDLRMYDFERVKDATEIAKKDSSSKIDENRDDDDDVECPYCKKETNEENFRPSTLFGEKGKGTKIWTPDQKELLKAEKNALYADDAKEYNHFIAHFRYHWLRGDPVVVRNVETEMSWDPSVIERAMRDPNIASISGNLGVKDNTGLNSSGLYAASFQHDAVVPVFACGADEYDELAKMKKTSTPMKGGGTSTSNANGANNAALQNKDDDAMITSVGKNEKKKRKSFLMASSSNAPKFSMALKDFFAGFFDPVLTFEGKLFQLRDFPRCIGGNRFNLKEVLPKHFRRLLAALPFRLYTNPEVGTINLFALQFQKYIRGGGPGGENFFQGVSSNSRSRGDVAAKKFVESLVKATFSYGSGTRTYVEGKSSIEMFGTVGSDDVCSVHVFSSSSTDDNNGDDKTIALWTVVCPQDAEEVLRRVEEHEDIEEDALYLTEDALRKALLPPTTTTTREKDKTTSDPTARPRCFAFAQKEKECVLLPGGSLRQILNVRSNCRADVKFSSPETVSGRRRRAPRQPPLVVDAAVVVADENDFFERRRVTVLKAAKACADVVLHEDDDDDSDDTEEDGTAAD